jgi:plastocyanin
MERLILAVLLLAPAVAISADIEYGLIIKDHQFIPAELKVPAGKKVKLIVSNHDSTPEEFESHSLNREKVIAGNAMANIYIGPLSPGKYPFFGEFNQKTAQGTIVVE